MTVFTPTSCIYRCVVPNDDKVRERVIALLGTKIKFPVTRSIILANTSNARRDKESANLEKLNEKLNEKLKVSVSLKQSGTNKL